MAKKRIRSLNFDIDWDDTAVVEKVKDIVDRETAKAAEIAYQTAEKLCPVDTGELINAIKIDKSLFPDGGYVVRVDNPFTDEKERKNFAIKVNSVEFGHFTHSKKDDVALKYIAPRPFMRPAIKKVKRTFRKQVQTAIEEGMA